MAIAVVVPTLDRERGKRVAQAACDNAGTDAYPAVSVDHNHEGYTATVNRALRQLEGETVCLLVDDCATSDGWLCALNEAMIERAKSNCWFAGPSGPCRTIPQNGGRPGDRRQPQFVMALAGFCLLIHRDALIMLGGLDARYRHYASDIDLQFRGRQYYGARSLWVPGVYVAHELHAPLEPWWTQDHETMSTIWRKQ
jgi:hypothetical protein